MKASLELVNSFIFVFTANMSDEKEPANICVTIATWIYVVLPKGSNCMAINTFINLFYRGRC